jgi:hypothetical protein
MTSKKSKDAILLIGVFLGILTALIIITGFWWWAIFGMKVPVGMALSITGFIVGMGALVALSSSTI